MLQLLGDPLPVLRPWDPLGYNTSKWKLLVRLLKGCNAQSEFYVVRELFVYSCVNKG